MKKPLITFILFTNKKGEYQWKAIHRNGNLVATNGEGLKNEKDRNRSMKNFIKAIQDLNYEVLKSEKKGK